MLVLIRLSTTRTGERLFPFGVKQTGLCTRQACVLFCRLSRREQAFSREDSIVYVCSMIIDAMSKWKTCLPHWSREPKHLDGKGVPLSFPLTCSKIHGFANIADWQYGGQIQGAGSGSNSMCNTILLNLHAVQDEKKELPRHLRLQMDNCAKDNKNYTVLGFLALLVQKGIVGEVQVSSVPAGSISSRQSCSLKLLTPLILVCNFKLLQFTVTVGL